MARCRDLRDGTTPLEFEEFTIEKDGKPFVYRVAKQPMPTPRQHKQPDPTVSLSQIVKRESAHLDGWSGHGITTEKRREKRKAQRRARKINRQTDISYRMSKQKNK
jgi:hypothetical protein